MAGTVGIVTSRYSNLLLVGVDTFYLSVLQLLLGFYRPYFKNTVTSTGLFWPADLHHTSAFEVLLVKFKTLDSEYFFQIVFIEMIITVQNYTFNIPRE